MEQVSKKEVMLEMIEEFLKYRYHLYINFSKHYGNFLTYFAKEQYGMKYDYKHFELIEAFDDYLLVLEILKTNENMDCVVSYFEEEDFYRVSILENVMKGLKGQDEYIQEVEMYCVEEKSLSKAFSRLDGYLLDEVEEEKKAHQGKKRSLKNVSLHSKG